MGRGNSVRWGRGLPAGGSDWGVVGLRAGGQAYRGVEFERAAQVEFVADFAQRRQDLLAQQADAGPAPCDDGLSRL
jgi:hypothetical protein